MTAVELVPLSWPMIQTLPDGPCKTQLVRSFRAARQARYGEEWERRQAETEAGKARVIAEHEQRKAEREARKAAKEAERREKNRVRMAKHRAGLRQTPVDGTETGRPSPGTEKAPEALIAREVARLEAVGMLRYEAMAAETSQRMQAVAAMEGAA